MMLPGIRRRGRWGVRFTRGDRSALPEGLSDALDVGGRNVSRRFDGTRDQIPRARRHLAQVLGRHHPCLQDALLLITELATNAVVHTRSGRPGGSYLLRIRTIGTWARIEVCDEGADSIPRLLPLRADSTAGRGIALVDRLALRWGVVRQADRNTVWFEAEAAATP